MKWEFLCILLHWEQHSFPAGVAMAMAHPCGVAHTLQIEIEHDMSLGSPSPMLCLKFPNLFSHTSILGCEGCWLMGGLEWTGVHWRSPLNRQMNSGCQLHNQCITPWQLCGQLHPAPFWGSVQAQGWKGSLMWGFKPLAFHVQAFCPDTLSSSSSSPHCPVWSDPGSREDPKFNSSSQTLGGNWVGKQEMERHKTVVWSTLPSAARSSDTQQEHFAVSSFLKSFPQPHTRSLMSNWVPLPT